MFGVKDKVDSHPIHHTEGMSCFDSVIINKITAWKHTEWLCVPIVNSTCLCAEVKNFVWTVYMYKWL